MGGKCVEIYQLRQFAAVAKTENMTRAAQSLSMAQPAVSKTIRNLDARREIEESLHRAGGLCICALSCVERLSDILAGFAAEYGNADFRIGSTPEGSDLLLDSAVSRDEVPAGAEVLFDEEICIAVPDGHRFADCGAVSLTELADDPFIALSGSESFQQVSEHIFRSAGIAMHAAIECDSLALQSRLLSCGMGIALAAAGEWRQLCEEGSVHLLHIRDAECRRYIYVQQLSRFETHSMRAFRAFLRRYFSEIG